MKKLLILLSILLMNCTGGEETITQNVVEVESPKVELPKESVELCEDLISNSFDDPFDFLIENYESPQGDTLKIYEDGYFEGDFDTHLQAGFMENPTNESQISLHHFEYEVKIFVNTNEGCSQYTCVLERVEVSPYDGDIYIDFRECSTQFAYGESLRNMWQNY